MRTDIASRHQTIPSSVTTSIRHYHSVKLTSHHYITHPLPPFLSHSFTSSAMDYSKRSSLTLKSRLASGDTLYGIFLLSNSPALAEIIGLSGYDYVVVDMEHGPGGIPDALACLRALAVTGTPAIIRLPELSAAWAKKALDIGPQGVMFPMIESAHEAELAVSYCRFPPKGIRGSAHTVVRASAYGFNEDYLRWCEDELMVFCQVESVAGVAAIEAIAAVDGVRAIQIGPRDLGASMGCLAEPENPKVREMLRSVERRALAAAAKGRGPFLAGMATALDSPEELLRRGYNMVANGVDLALFRKAAVHDVRGFRKALAFLAAGDKDEKDSYQSGVLKTNGNVLAGDKDGKDSRQSGVLKTNGNMRNGSRCSITSNGY